MLCCCWSKSADIPFVKSTLLNCRTGSRRASCSAGAAPPPQNSRVMFGQGALFKVLGFFRY
jgi:hypothetical protein